MITQTEISSLNLSPTKKDFVQIWNELIEVASKITERWDPTSTNESDPGIVLLKVLTGIADKLNYNIDKNILEAYMPTAAQMESMRKLCELVGYDIKYYQSAETTVRISYTGNTSDPTDENEEKLPKLGLALPRFTTLTNADKDITFVTTNELDALLTNSRPWVDVPCIEGQISKCESVNGNLITAAQLDANNRYYLPEIQIAENGIFVYNAVVDSQTNELTDGEHWTQVTNLNTQPTGSPVYKFGYDSLEGRPYLAFPSDIGNLISDGLFIYFIRTSGLNGNIAPRTLELLEPPAGEAWSNYSAEQFEVVNVDATSNGANIESISTAYNNFKKTVGTFDTLVTCRDYMNKIYSLMDASNYPYVSNILVTDIRNDINNAITLCSCNEYGILYKETGLTSTISNAANISVQKAHNSAGNYVNRLNIVQTKDREVPLLDHFDLVLYPFKTFTQVSPGVTKLAVPYNESFTYTEQMNSEITAAIADLKTCAHKITTPNEGDIVAINNYLRLNAFIATAIRVSEVEAKDILHNVKVALVNAFNLRNLDFGEEIPFDSILSVIENADPRIKVVSLQEPTVLTTYSVKELKQELEGYTVTSKEYGIASTADSDKIKGVTYDVNNPTAKDIYNKLVLRNILAGRAALFEYEDAFEANNSEKPYTLTKDITAAVEEPELLLDDPAIRDPKITDIRELAEILRRVTQIAEEIKVAKADINTLGEHVLYTTEGGVKQPIQGFYGGTVTLRVFDLIGSETTSDGETYETIERVQEVYETYEYRFIPQTAVTFARNARSTSPASGELVNNIGRVEASCEITSTTPTFKNITLKQNEVIKFRAPNLITTQTFPAYVYYRFEKKKTGTSTGTETQTVSDMTEGRRAEVESLISFINRVGKQKFFTKLWDSTSSGRYLSTWNAELVPETENDKINQANWLKNVFSYAIACGTEDGSKIFTSEAEITQYLAEELANGTTKITFKYCELRKDTMDHWSSTVTTLDNMLPREANQPILWRLGSSGSHPIGKLVTGRGQKLLEQDGDTLLYGSVGDSTFICTDYGCDPLYSTIPGQSDIALGSGDKLFIHYTPSSTNEDGETVDAEPISIVFEGGKDPENPIIIRPSKLDLVPSEDLNKQGVSWKKQGVRFPGESEPKDLLALAPNEQIEIRSISKVILSSHAKFYKNFENKELERGSSDKVITYELKDGEYLFYTDQKTQEAAYYGSGSVITLDKETYIPKATKPIEISQILEQGLHVVPWSSEVPLDTNRKITITEYQYINLTEGDTLHTLTLPTKEAPTGSNNTEPLYVIGRKTGSNNSWVPCLSTADAPIKYTAAGESSPQELSRVYLGDDPNTKMPISWEVCSFLELATSPGYAQPLRAAEMTQSTGDTSEAQCTIMDKVLVYDEESNPIVEIAPQKTTQFELVKNSANSETGSVVAKEAYAPVSFKLNTIVQTASGNFVKPEADDEEETAEQAKLEMLQMKLFSEEAPVLYTLENLDADITPISAGNPQSNAIKFANFVAAESLNNYWSTLDIAEKLSEGDQDDSPRRPSALNLNFMIPDPDLFGVFSIYLATSQESLDTASAQDMLNSTTRVFIDIPEMYGEYKDVLTIYNYQYTDENEKTYHWWSEGVDPNKPNRLYLRAGLNCIMVHKSCNILIKAEKAATGTLIYDNLRLVRGRDKLGINLKLLEFQADPEATEQDKAKEILENIAKLDKKHEFYYNAPIENSLAIEFNENINSFASPYTLYDINNINNNFVVSKLDIKYLDTGLQIAKSSKF